jgi:hypothetical protein
MPPSDDKALECCGMPMVWQEAFGIRRYSCSYRSHHPAIWVSQNTGQGISDYDLAWHSQEESDAEEQLIAPVLVICPCGAHVPHCHCAEVSGAHRHGQ